MQPILARVCAERSFADELADADEAHEIGFLSGAELLRSFRSVKKLSRWLAGLRMQDEPSQQQYSDHCPNCYLIPMLGPTARAPPLVHKANQRATIKPLNTNQSCS